VSEKNYDIIGDIHGHAEKLKGLLKILGYRVTDGAWRHPERTAIFVGDLIDRGPEQTETAAIVRRMVDAGSARCILGNHEFNAIAWATPDPEAPGEYLRRHGSASNRAQHQAFLTEVEGRPLHRDLIAWFKTLPLWLDLGDIRAVHACWNDVYMDQLKPILGPDNTLTDDLFVRANRKGDWVFEAVDALCKGLEINLPDGASFQDKDGQVRHSARIKWWAPDFSSLRNFALAPKSVLEGMHDISLSYDPRLVPYQGPPVFFGHYWRTGLPTILSKNSACLDYSVGKNGPLVAYRWNGESELKDEHLESFGNEH
jgi:hypothetical protein